jgi:hypothetical protein
MFGSFESWAGATQEPRKRRHNPAAKGLIFFTVASLVEKRTSGKKIAGGHEWSAPITLGKGAGLKTGAW